MKQDLCISRGQEGPNCSYIVQVVKSDLGNFTDVLIERKGRIKSNTKVVDIWTEK